MVREGKHLEDLSKREYQTHLRNAARSGDLNKQRDLVEKLRRKFGDREAGSIIARSGADVQVPGVAELVKKSPIASASLGGRKVTLTREGARKAAPVAAGAGGAYALTRGGDNKGGNGVTVIRS